MGYKSIWDMSPHFHIHYPPAWPIMLAPILHFWGYNFFVMRLLLLMLTIGSFFLAYRILGRDDKKIVFLSLFFSAISYLTLFFSYHILSEIPYLFFSLLALYFIEKYRRTNKFLSYTVLITVFFIVISFYTRTIGISLAVSTCLYLLIEGKVDKKFRMSIKKVTLLAILIGILCSFWFIMNYIVKNKGGSYINAALSRKNPFSFNEQWSLFDVIVRSIYSYLFYAIPNVVTGIQVCSRSLIAFFISAIVLFGFFQSLLKKRTIIEYYIIFYMSILFLWPGSTIAGIRFLFPLIFFIFYYFFSAISQILGKFIKKATIRNMVFAIIVVVMIFTNIRSTISYIKGTPYINGETKENNKEFLKIIEWIKHNTPSNAVFLARNIAGLYMYSNRKGFTLPFYIDENHLSLLIKSQPIDYVILDTSVEDIKIKDFKTLEGLKEIYRYKSYRIYKTVK